MVICASSGDSFSPQFSSISIFSESVGFTCPTPIYNLDSTPLLSPRSNKGNYPVPDVLCNSVDTYSFPTTMKRSASTHMLLKAIGRTFSVKTTKVEAEWSTYRYYPLLRQQYHLLEEIGRGRGSIVYMAKCVLWDEIVAIKCVDLDDSTIDPTKVQHEVQTLMLLAHPNVLSPHCAFMVSHSLWQVMPFMPGGSLKGVLSFQGILKALYPAGLEEPLIATVLKEVLKALEYVHEAGHIHRDVKAANILIDGDGAVKLGGFGESVRVFDSGDGRKTKQKTFAGTVSWMAPEVVFAQDEIGGGYDCRADIWSFGITAMEMACGHPPVPQSEPMRAIAYLARGGVPKLEGPRFSKSFKDMVNSCVVRDPQKRPSAKKLLKHSFFKQKAKTAQYIAAQLMHRLPPLTERLKIMREEACRRVGEAMDIPNPAQVQKTASFSECVRRINKLSMPGKAKYRGNTV